MADEINYDLIFTQPPTGPDLVFGEKSSGGQVTEFEFAGQLPGLKFDALSKPNIRLGLEAQLPPLSASIQYRDSPKVEATIVLPGMQMASSLEYDPRVSRPTVSFAVTRHQSAQSIASATTDGFDATLPQRTGAEVGHQVAIPVAAWQEQKCPDVLSPITMYQTGVYQDAEHIGNLSEALFSEMVRDVSPMRAVCHQDGVHETFGNSHGWVDLVRLGKSGFIERHQDTLQKSITSGSDFASAIPTHLKYDERHQDAKRPRPGLDPIGPVVVPPVCYLPNTKLVFSFGSANGDPELLFQCDFSAPVNPENPPSEAGVVVPVRKAYIIMNEVRLFKVEGNVELPVLSLSLDIDMDSWTWGFNVTLPAESLSLVSSSTQGAPVELDATVNGETFRMLAETISRTRTFGRSTVTVQGRGQSAYLSSPYSPVLDFYNAEGKTAQQMMIAALTTNGVSIGWEVDWGITDWFVPANVWSKRGSYIEAVTSITNAVGAYVLPHASEKKLLIRPRYPALPWQWDTVTPDFELPADVVDTESIKWEEKPAYNGIYVSGTNNGVLGYVKRTGSAGNYMAPMITDPLITHVDAVRMAGSAVLADTGRMTSLTLSLPVLPETGIIKPGKMVRYVDGTTSVIGLVKGVSVSMSAAPSLRQTIEVETHA